MNFWLNKRETGSPYDQADALFEEAVMLSSVPARIDDAERCLAAAVAAYRDLVPRTRGFDARRRLAKALWRQASFTALIRGRPEDALQVGYEALELGREALQALDVSHAAFDATVQELSGALNDVAQICFAAGRTKEREQHLIEAARVARRSRGMGGRQALGTAMHNLAQHRAQGLQSALAPGEPTWTVADAAAVLAPAERAFELRTRLCEEPQAQPYLQWELANSALQLGRLLHSLGRRSDAAKVLRAGLASLRNITGATTEPLRDELTATLESIGEPPSPEHDSSPGEKTRSLSPGALVLLELTCLLERDDRSATLLSLWFPDAWRAHAGAAPPPSFDGALAELMKRGIITERICQGNGRHYATDYVVERWMLGAVSDEKAEDFCLSVANLWIQRFDADRAAPGTNPVRSGIAAAVYARRGGRFASALDILERSVLGIACQRGEWQQVLLHMQIAAEASEDPALIERMDRATARLARAHHVEGHPKAALDAAAWGLDRARRRGAGALGLAHWRELRLDLLYRAGRYQDVLDEIDSALRALLDVATDEPLTLARMRESMLHHGVGAAKALQRWQLALDLNRAIVESLEDRGASETARARQRMADYAGLLELGDLVAADTLLVQCQSILRSGEDPAAFAAVLAARGIVASRRGDVSAAIDCKRWSLDTRYRSPSDPSAVAHAHAIYANELARLRESRERAGLHWLAAALLYALVGERTSSAAVLEGIVAAQRIATFRTPRDLATLTRGLEQDGFAFERALRETKHSQESVIVEEVFNNSVLT